MPKRYHVKRDIEATEALSSAKYYRSGIGALLTDALDQAAAGDASFRSFPCEALSSTDGKLRVRVLVWSDSVSEARLRQAGFRWSARERAFVAECTSEREALLLALCGTRRTP